MIAAVHPRISGVTAAVLLAHSALLWLALHRLNAPAPTGEAEHIIVASVVSEMPAPVASPHSAHTQPQTPQRPQTQAVPKPAAQQALPNAVAATAAVAEPAPPAAATPTSPSAAPGTVRSATPAPAVTVMLPSSDADYLNNPPPAYPRMSRRMGEQGAVLVRLLISVDGRAEQAEIRVSSGYARLDEAALETVKRWRYVPGKRAGVPEAMWFNVPVRFVLD